LVGSDFDLPTDFFFFPKPSLVDRLAFSAASALAMARFCDGSANLGVLVGGGGGGGG
jgi:hypothetical protein